MAKLIWLQFKPDDPIFSGRAIVSVPVTRRWLEDLERRRAAADPMQPVADKLEEVIRRKVSEDDTGPE